MGSQQRAESKNKRKEKRRGKALTSRASPRPSRARPSVWRAAHQRGAERTASSAQRTALADMFAPDFEEPFDLPPDTDAEFDEAIESDSGTSLTDRVGKLREAGVRLAEAHKYSYFVAFSFINLISYNVFL